jgi:hypothetical protein
VIGKLFVPGVKGPYRHPRIWKREPTDERERLRIGAGVGTIGLVRALAAELAEPLAVLVVLHAPREGDGARLQSPEVARADVERFLDRFGELFEDDARAALWIGETEKAGLVVLDEHDLIYAYGPLHRFEQVLRERGFRNGDPIVPEPHEHRSSPQFDADERELRTWWSWHVEALPRDEQLGGARPGPG